MPTQERAQNAKIISPNVHRFSKGDSGDDSDDPRWRLAQRIASSRSIGRSPLLRKFLLYVCSRHAQGEASELTEHQIGIHVFGRFEGYDSNEDNIVRNYARTLRKRVGEYFATEGKHEELGLDIPRGGYIPIFYSRVAEKPILQNPRMVEASSIHVVEGSSSEKSPSSSAHREEPVPEQPVPSEEPPLHPFPNSHRGAVFLWTVALCALVAVPSIALYGLLTIGRGNGERAPRETVQRDPLWSQLFQKDRDTFIVAADSGLVILEGLTGHRVTLDEYASGRYRAAAGFSSKLPSADVEELGTRRYTSIIDLEFVLRLSRLKEVIPERMLLRYSRDLHMDNLRSANAILLGSADANPWASLFEQQLNFRFSFDPKKRAAPVIINQHPLAGEQSAYVNDYDGLWHKTYGTLSYLPNLDGTGHVLLVAGIDMAGTQAAGSFVLNPSLMKTVLERAKAPEGGIRAFEILIESSNIAASASSPRAVIERIGR